MVQDLWPNAKTKKKAEANNRMPRETDGGKNVFFVWGQALINVFPDGSIKVLDRAAISSEAGVHFQAHWLLVKFRS